MTSLRKELLERRKQQILSANAMRDWSREYVLEFGTVIPLTLTLSRKSCSGRANTQHTPVLFEDAKIGRVQSFGIPYTSISMSHLTSRLQHGGFIP